MPLNKESQ